jgi:GMP synthase PP-ATPase subunit
MKANIISKLEELLANADISAVANKVKDLQREYEQSFSKEMEKAKQEFVDDGGKAKDFVYSKTAEDTKIIQLFEQYRKLKKQDE